jgi:hypothetical protein
MPAKLGRVKNTSTHLDFEFLRADGSKRGEIRLKPNRILWAEANEKGWHGVSLRKFREFIKKEGEHQGK